MMLHTIQVTLGGLFLLWWHEAPSPIPLLMLLIPHFIWRLMTEYNDALLSQHFGFAPLVLFVQTMGDVLYSKQTWQQSIPLNTHLLLRLQLPVPLLSLYSPWLPGLSSVQDWQREQNPHCFLIHSILTVPKTFPESYPTSKYFPSYLSNAVSIFILPPLHFLLPRVNNAPNWALTDFLKENLYAHNS